MKSFAKFIIESGGEEVGQLEVARISLSAARDFAEEQFLKYQSQTLDQAMPFFDKHFIRAQKLAKRGKTQRKDMPVIDNKDVKELQWRLTQGAIDIKEPFAQGTNPKDRFPLGLSGKQAQDWLSNGLPVNDKGPAHDDVIHCKETRLSAGALRPIQRQIYFDKSIVNTAKNGIEPSKRFLMSSWLVLSSDGYILDGHHRWMSLVLIDPTLTMQILQIDKKLNDLLPLSLSFTDAVGNKRNA